MNQTERDKLLGGGILRRHVPARPTPASDRRGTWGTAPMAFSGGRMVQRGWGTEQFDHVAMEGDVQRLQLIPRVPELILA